MRTLVLLVVLLGCDHGLHESDRLAREGAQQAAARAFLPPPERRRPPPPPPPPPSLSSRFDLPPPAEITEFLRTHADAPGPWQVTLYELPDRRRKGPRFMGAHVRRRRALGREASAELVTKLSRNVYSEREGVCGCWVETSLGIRIARGSATLDLVYNTGRLFLTAEWPRGPVAELADATWLDDVWKRAGI